MMDEHTYALGEMDRRMGNLLRFGTVSQVDTANALVKIDIGDLVTDWLPWLTMRAGQDRIWRAPDIGEQVVLLSPGDPSQGVVLGAVFQTTHPANGNSQDVERTTYKDGTVVEYNRATHQLLVDASASSGTVLVKCSTATVQATASVTLDTPETHCTGKLTVDNLLTYKNGIAGTGGGNGNTITGSIVLTGGDVTADGIGLKSHHHSDPQGGNTSSAIA